MRTVFLDTSWVVALLRPRDQHHRKALRLAGQLAGVRLLTHRGVLAEVGNAFSRRPFRADGIAYLRSVEADPGVEIVDLGGPVYDAGLALSAARPDKDWGLVDCVSFALMAERGLTDALTADDHFAQAGFAALLVP